MLNKVVVLVFLLLAVVSCKNKSPEAYSPEFSTSTQQQVMEYVIGVHPLHNPERLQEMFGPIVDYLTSEIPNATFRLEASRNYAAFDNKLYAGKFHFSIPNPYQTVNSLKHGYTVFGKWAGDESFCGIIVVRKNGNIKKIEDLKGKSVSFPAPSALAATMMPQYYMQTHGLDVMKDIDIKYVGSQESSIMNVFYGNTEAGSTWPPPWKALIKERPELAEALEVKWTTEPLINNGFVVKTDVSPKILLQVEEILFALHTHEKGRLWLERMEVSKFEPATNQSYEIVNEFLEKFNAEVRLIDH